jgi:hypothetical protein
VRIGMKTASLILALSVCSVLGQSTNLTGRFQIVASHESSSAIPTMMKIDTWTGETWFFLVVGKDDPRPVWVPMATLHYRDRQQVDSEPGLPRPETNVGKSLSTNALQRSRTTP